MTIIQRSACFSLFLLLAFAGKTMAQAQTVNFNFSATAAPVSGWTNVIGDPSIGTVTAQSAGITVSSVGSTHWVPFNGASAFNGVGENTGTALFPGGVLFNHWYQYGSQAEYNATDPQLLISGLSPDSSYTIQMAGSSTSALNSNPVQYTVAGLTVATSQYENNHNNTGGNYATFSAVVPNSSGQIWVFINTTPSTDIADISGLIISRGSALSMPTDSITITSPVNGAVLGEPNSLQITANASSSGGSITKVDFYHDTTLIGTSTTAPYSVTWLNPDPGNYQLIARATDNTGQTVSASVRISIGSTNYWWSTTGNIATNGDTNFIGTVDTNRLSFRTNNIERLSITKQGTVMVGAKVPDSGNCKLKIIGTTWTSGFIMPTGAAAGYVLTSDASGTASWQPGGSSGGRWQFINGTVYDSLDNIAIGTNNPQGYKLAVNGAAIFTKIVAKPQQNWPDYVFNKDYHLPSLQELEQYIQTHHHLPGVTPEAEIKRSGIDLADQQTSLLKKVEELTLYIIQQNARLETQQKEIDELKAIIKSKP